MVQVIALPPIAKWPCQSGFSFSTWFRLEPKSSVVTEHERLHLFSFRTLKGLGYSAHFIPGGVVFTCMKVVGKGIQHTLFFDFQPRKVSVAQLEGCLFILGLSFERTFRHNSMPLTFGWGSRSIIWSILDGRSCCKRYLKQLCFVNRKVLRHSWRAWPDFQYRDMKFACGGLSLRNGCGKNSLFWLFWWQRLCERVFSLNCLKWLNEQTKQRFGKIAFFCVKKVVGAGSKSLLPLYESTLGEIANTQEMRSAWVSIATEKVS